MARSTSLCVKTSPCATKGLGVFWKPRAKRVSGT